MIKFEVHYEKKRIEFSEDNYIKLPEIIEVIKKEFYFQDNDNIQIYNIDENQIVEKQILNNEDLQSCKKKISENEYFIKLKINIEPESQKNKDIIFSKSNNIILESKIENDDKNSPAPFPLKSSVLAEKKEEFPRLLEENKNKESNIDVKIFEQKLKLCESNHLKEMQSLNEKINEMSKKISILMTIIFKFLKSKKNFYKKIEEDIANKIKNNFDDYDKKMNIKINEIKNELNEKTSICINEQINKLLPKIKNSNDNKVCNINQIKIIKNNDNNIIDKNKKISNNSPNKKKTIDLLEKKNQKLEDNHKNVNKKDENLNNDKINKIEVENNSNNTKNILKKESPKKCQNELEKVNNNNIKINNRERDFRLRKKPTYQRRYNNNIKKEELDRIKEDKNEIIHNDSKKEEKHDFQDKSKNIINDNQTNKNYYYFRINKQSLNFNNKIKIIEGNDNPNLLELTVPKIEISKKGTNKAYSIMNKIFFEDYQQKNVKFEKINDFELELLKKGMEKDFNEGKFALKNYCQNYIEEIVLPIFKKTKLNNEQFKVLEYNIEKILESCGLPKNYYSHHIFEEKIKNNEVDRKKSFDALREFRKKFAITEIDFSDEGIIKRLEENGLDINKTFQKMFG